VSAQSRSHLPSNAAITARESTNADTRGWPGGAVGKEGDVELNGGFYDVFNSR
jgi:hypothetical protein